MDLNELVKEKVEPDYIDGHVDAEAVKVAKRKKVFLPQINKGVAEMKVINNKF